MKATHLYGLTDMFPADLLSPDVFNVELIGFVAAFFTSASFLPQAIMVIRSRKTDGLSLTMYMMFTCGISLWLTYGIVTMAWPLICANTVTITLASCILSIMISNRWKAGSNRRLAKTRLAKMKSTRLAAA